MKMHWGFAGSLLIALALGGCGAHHDGDGGTFAAGGSSGSVKAYGGLTLSIGTPSQPTTGYACPVNRTYHVGTPAPDALSPGTPVVNGGGNVISCSVAGGVSFVLNGKLSAPSTEGATLSFSVSDGGASPSASTSASANVSGSDLGDATLASDIADPSTTCTVDVVDGQLKPGAVWGKLDCPSLRAAPSTECHVAGFFLFENCDGA